MRSGFVYILGNPGLSAYKIGQTTRTIEIRAAELLREYGTVHPFEIASRHAVNNPAAVEALAHRILANDRIPRSELFCSDLDTCRRAVLLAARIVDGGRWWLRVWLWLTLPRPRSSRPRYRPRRPSYRRDDPTALLLLVVVVGIVFVLAVLKPDLPPWFPSSLLRAAALLAHRY